MNAAVVSQFGAAPAYRDFSEPAASAGTVVLDVLAAALSPLARRRASGAHYSSATELPFVAGVDGVGRSRDGRRWYFLLPDAPFGSFAERVAVRPDELVAVPERVDDVTAAAIAIPGMSSHAALTYRARIVPGDRVLVNGATGSSGRLAVTIARRLGASFVAATGRNTTVLAALGADAIVDLTAPPDELAATLEALAARRIDIVLDYLWGDSAVAIIRAHVAKGDESVPLRFVQIGSIGGESIVLPGAALRSNGLVLMGSGLGSVATADLRVAIAGVFAAIEPAALSIDAEARPLRDVTSAWAAPGSERIVFVP